MSRRRRKGLGAGKKGLEAGGKGLEAAGRWVVTAVAMGMEAPEVASEVKELPVVEAEKEEAAAGK